MGESISLCPKSGAHVANERGIAFIDTGHSREPVTHDTDHEYGLAVMGLWSPVNVLVITAQRALNKQGDSSLRFASGFGTLEILPR